jgi:hypothetical protein
MALSAQSFTISGLQASLERYDQWAALYLLNSSNAKWVVGTTYPSLGGLRQGVRCP